MVCAPIFLKLRSCIGFALQCQYLDQKLFGQFDVAYDHMMGKLVDVVTRSEQWKTRSQSD